MTGLTVGALLAAEELDPQKLKPGLLGLIVFVLLFVAVYFLYRSLTKRLKRSDAFYEERDAQLPDAELPDAELPDEQSDGDRSTGDAAP